MWIKTSKLSAYYIRMNKTEEVCLWDVVGVKWVWQQKDACTPPLSHIQALFEEGGHDLWGGISSKSRNHKLSHTFTRFALNAFTSAATPTSNRYNSLVLVPNSMIFDSLESLRCLVSRECGFIAFGPAVQKLWAKEWRLSKTGLHFDIRFCGLKLT